MKAQKKPVIIDFFDVQIEAKETVDSLQKWVESFGDDFEKHFELDPEGHFLKVKTLEGTSYDVSSADVIIRGIKGEFYPCKKAYLIPCDILKKYCHSLNTYTEEERKLLPIMADK